MSPLLLLAPAAFAQSNPPVRRTRLQDGREFVGEVLGTEASGLRIRVPAGEMLVSFEDLIEVKPIDATAYAAQKPWRVVLAAPEGLLPPTRALVDAIPGVTARPVGQADDGLSPAQAEALVDCAGEITCMRTVLKDQPWQWIVTLSMPEEEGAPLTVTSVVSTADRAIPASRTVPTVDAAGLWSALHQAIQLEAPKDAPPAVEGLGPKPRTPKTGHPAGELPPGASFVPIPGWTAFKTGSAANGALALGGVVAFTAGSVAAGAALHSGAEEGTTSIVQMGLFGAVGYLSSTWAVNELVGPNHKTALVPTGNGVQVAGAF